MILRIREMVPKYALKGFHLKKHLYIPTYNKIDGDDI